MSKQMFNGFRLLVIYVKNFCHIKAESNSIIEIEMFI